jgi:sulfate/thiosulfate transport system permease protein
LASNATVVEQPAGAAPGRAGGALAKGVATGYLSLVVLLPLAALIWSSRSNGLGEFWDQATQPEAMSALKLTLGVAAVCALVNAVTGTAIAWVLVRDRFPGKGIVDSVIDLPFALPTIVAGLTLLALYGPGGAFGIDVAFTKIGLLLALLFVTLPFVVRAVQPVLLELDTEMEEAAASLGATSFGIFRRIVFPNLLPAILSGVALAYARAVGEFGAVVLISGNLPFQTQVSSVYIFKQLESSNEAGAAAVSVLLLAISLGVLLGIGAFRRWRTRHDHA